MNGPNRTLTLQYRALCSLYLLRILLLFCLSNRVVTGSIIDQASDHHGKVFNSTHCLSGNTEQLSAAGQHFSSVEGRSTQKLTLYPLVHVHQKTRRSRTSRHANLTSDTFRRWNSSVLVHMATVTTSKLSNKGGAIDADSNSDFRSLLPTELRRPSLQRERRGFRRRVLLRLSGTKGGEIEHGKLSRKLIERNELLPGPARAPGDINVKHWKAPLLENGPLIIVNVAHDGTGDFVSIQQAIDSVPARNTQRVLIRIRAGLYREKVVVPYNKPFITFHGDEDAVTLITWNATASTSYGSTKYTRKNATLFGTLLSASVSILSDGFVAQHITFENSAPAPEPGAVGAQAVAFLIAGDKAAFYFCRFLGAQDTLYDYTGRHYYMSCYIQGSIDFIFGNGRSLFQQCILHSIATSFGAIAAHQRQSLEDDTGFSFDRCEVKGSGMLYLGRAWSPFARIVFARTYFEDIIFAEGWSDFGDPRRRRTTFFGQYQCTGPGANVSERAPWSKQLTENDVLPFLSLNFVNGNDWLPST